MTKNLAYLVLLFVIQIATAQTDTTNYDIILKTNGEEMEGNIKEINDDAIKFVYKNESIAYKVNKGDIVKITFSSGRVEFFNKLTTQNSSSNSKKFNLEDHHNKVAILPFGYIKDQEDGSRAMSNKIQNETFSLFNKNRAGLSFQNTQTTNALLIKAGVRDNNIQGFTMGEICNILSVEYVIQGVVSVERTTQSNINTSSSTTKNKGNNAYVTKNGRIIGDVFGNGKSKTSSSSISTNIQNYATSMTINIYNDRGDSIFSQDHTSFWNTQDAYKITLKYLAKRSPLFKR
ncbi:MAG: hypothetical protein L3J20_09350 [Flavobacteriaceae bacterium]|nr:hypothetical protein [Flavobacteriaceae bacterium]